MRLKVTKYMHSRYAMLLAVSLMALAAWSTCFSGDFVRIAGDRGIALPSANCWIASADISYCAGLFLCVAIIAMIIFVNRSYNLLRDMSMLPIVLFAFMMAATPELSAQLYTGSVLCLTVSVCIALMFGCYSRPDRRRRVFMVFFLLSAGTATQYSFAAYIPVMLMCCGQMRILSLRTVIAAILGIVTPWWLMFGFGIVTPEELHMPEISSLFSKLGTADGLQLGATALATSIIFIASVALDFFRTMAYNARARSYNGTIVLTGFMTIVAMIADYNNMVSYMIVLNMCAALQCAQFFIIHRTERSWLGIAGVLAAYASLYLWKIMP